MINIIRVPLWKLHTCVSFSFSFFNVKPLSLIPQVLWKIPKPQFCLKLIVFCLQSYASSRNSNSDHKELCPFQKQLVLKASNSNLDKPCLWKFPKMSYLVQNLIVFYFDIGSHGFDIRKINKIKQDMGCHMESSEWF